MPVAFALVHLPSQSVACPAQVCCCYTDDDLRGRSVPGRGVAAGATRSAAKGGLLVGPIDTSMAGNAPPVSRCQSRPPHFKPRLSSRRLAEHQPRVPQTTELELTLPLPSAADSLQSRPTSILARLRCPVYTSNILTHLSRLGNQPLGDSVCALESSSFLILLLPASVSWPPNSISSRNSSTFAMSRLSCRSRPNSSPECSSAALGQVGVSRLFAQSVN